MLFKILKRLMTGEVIQSGEFPISGGMVTLRLKLKREKKSGELYVTLSTSSIGNGNFQYLSLEEFSNLSAAVQQIQNTVKGSDGFGDRMSKPLT